MKYLKIIILFFCTIVISYQQAKAQPGSLDTSFGNGGLIVTNAFTSLNKSLIQPDGKILVYTINTSLARYNPDGSYDSSFGVNGYMLYYYYFNGTVDNWNNCFGLQNDGKIICSGQYFTNGKTDAIVFRCNPDGSVDSSFGINGIDTVELDNITYVSALLVQPDGKIVVAGNVQKNINDEWRIFLYRLMPDGGLDPGFGVGGSIVIHFPRAIDPADLIIRPNGKLVLGSTYDSNNDQPYYMLQSFNPDGSIDAGFGTDGIAKFKFGEGQPPESWSSEMSAMALQPDGKIICTGTSGLNEFQMALCRFNEDGSMDAGFGENGGVITPYLNYKDIENFDVTLQPDGKILTSGFIYFDDWPIILVRYLPNGELDPGFGVNGISTAFIESNESIAQNIHILPNGKLFVVGSSTTYFGDSYILLARFNGDNVLATNFKNVQTKQDKESVTISWQTLNESGTKNYSIERSSNATDFTSIATVPAKGGQENSYSYTDHHPLEGTSYYRIKENALNGTATFSNTLKVIFESNTISLYPNPAKNTVTIKGLNKNATATIRITDMHGRELLNQKINNSSNITLPIRTLAQGSYFVLIEQNGKVEKLRFVKE